MTVKLSGKGRLTDASINLMQNYFGMAIRQNDKLYPMKKAVLAVLWHCCEGDAATHHQFCPRTNTSWCKWQRDKITGQCTYKNKLNLPVAIKDLLHQYLWNLVRKIFCQNVYTAIPKILMSLLIK